MRINPYGPPWPDEATYACICVSCGIGLEVPHSSQADEAPAPAAAEAGTAASPDAGLKRAAHDGLGRKGSASVVQRDPEAKVKAEAEEAPRPPSAKGLTPEQAQFPVGTKVKIGAAAQEREDGVAPAHGRGSTGKSET